MRHAANNPVVHLELHTGNLPPARIGQPIG
jgi:hypothetical protein